LLNMRSRNAFFVISQRVSLWFDR